MTRNTNRIQFLNTYIDNLTAQEAKDVIDTYVQDGGIHYVVTPNSDIIVKMQDDPELKKICDMADLILTDGQMLVKISKWLKHPIKERVAMTDFVWDVLDLADSKGYKVFFLGGKEKTLKKAVGRIKKKYPRLCIAGFDSPPLGFEKDAEKLCQTNTKIIESSADIIIVFLGCPKQEKFIYSNKDIYHVPVSITMGGCVDFIAGNVKRAPLWMQRAGLEWFYRFMQEPKRLFTRYFIVDTRIFKMALSYKRKGWTRSLRKKRILIISTVGLRLDGITGVILSYLEAMDRSGMEIYVAGTILIQQPVRTKLETMGCQIVELPDRQTETWNYFWALQKFIHRQQIQVVHAHGNSATLAVEMVAAWMGGCRKRIAHSHNTRSYHARADRLLRPVFCLFYTDALACGRDAGNWLFGRKSCIVLKNGRDIGRYGYNEMVRKEARSKYRLADQLAIGHIGGFVSQKNHEFAVAVYIEILKIRPDARLFFVGDGPLRETVEAACSDYRENIIFTGYMDCVPEFLQAMDGMILPSLFEGLPLVTVEWQINGLPSILSSSITKECVLTEFTKQLSLECAASRWAETLVSMVENRNRKEDALTGAENVRKAGYNIADSAKVLRQIYLEE